MVVKDDILKAARAGLGDGFESASVAECKSEIIRRFVRLQLASLYRRRVNVTAEAEASRVAQDALAAEQAALAEALAAADAKAARDVEGI